MEQLVLKQDVIDSIKGDPDLFAKVSKELRVSPMTLPKRLLTNDIRLTQAGVLRILREHLGLAQDSDLLTEMQEA